MGRVVGTHGVHGELKVILLTDFPQRFRPGTRLYIQQGDNSAIVTVAGARYAGKSFLLKLVEINDADHAGALRGAALRVEPWEVEPLPEGHYYHFQLIGSRVYTITGEYLGILTEIFPTGANDIYVARDDSGKEILIPALKTVVRRIDLARKELHVKLPPGLLD